MFHRDRFLLRRVRPPDQLLLALAVRCRFRDCEGIWRSLRSARTEWDLQKSKLPPYLNFCAPLAPATNVLHATRPWSARARAVLLRLAPCGTTFASPRLYEPVSRFWEP